MRVLVDTDPGNGIPGADIDDGLALGLLLRSPEITVEAVMVVAGNVDVDTGVSVARAVLESAGAGDIPVYRGAARPLVQDPSVWRARLDRRRRVPSAARHSQVQAMVDLVMAAPGEITVLAIGPLTNVAAAMLLEPGFADAVARIVVMGGAFEVPGVLQELNFSYDPEAAHLVLTGRVPVTVVPLDVTMRTFLRLEDVDRLAAAGTPLAMFLADTARPWVRSQPGERCFLHDPLAAAILIDPTLVRTRAARADVELHGTLTRGRSIAWDPGGRPWAAPYIPLPDARPVDIAHVVDADCLLALLLDRLTGRPWPSS